jgi:hypothetical protein
LARAASACCSTSRRALGARNVGVLLDVYRVFMDDARAGALS